MHNKRLTILAINLGTRYLGIAVLKRSILIDWSVKVVNGMKAQFKLNKAIDIITSLIDYYQPDTIVLKKLHSSRSSLRLNKLSLKVEELSMINRIKLIKYSIQEVEAFHSPERRINKTTLAELICQKHPVLRHELQKEQNNLNPYHIRMFEAVALGTMAEEKCQMSTSSTDVNLVFPLSCHV